ncbi:MAG: iron ABC transporter permease [Candidatus Bathyarchaeota archaeon]|nr:iron ABC transporter permease [Candidatus Bathyarchaeum sp.]
MASESSKLETKAGKTRYYWVLFALTFTLFIVFLVSLGIGRYSIPVDKTVKALLMQPNIEQVVKDVIFKIRLPRIVAATLIGASLSISGASFQGVFKNPLVSSHILGVASGAGFGAAVAIILGMNITMIQLFAFTFGIAAVVASFGISNLYKSSSALSLVLSGIIVSSFFSALISLMKYIADPRDTLPEIVFWLMGSLATVNTDDVFKTAPVIVAGITGLLLIRWRINIISMGDEEAQALGVNVKRLRSIIIALSTIITAAAVCVSGVIGWIGLVIPHVGRMLVGPDYKKLLPISTVIGAVYLLIVDDIARTLTTGEIPLGILTALIGTPFFAYILWKSKVSWS